MQLSNTLSGKKCEFVCCFTVLVPFDGEIEYIIKVLQPIKFNSMWLYIPSIGSTVEPRYIEHVYFEIPVRSKSVFGPGQTPLWVIGFLVGYFEPAISKFLVFRA